ncbi:hypothetical protein B0H14DRAFT_3504407 [Mycena olivaceomarginata]|nr:hypothetical protein B0H14DRAFT_3504407 [Mycena olivaceomarginata]
MNAIVAAAHAKDMHVTCHADYSAVDRALTEKPSTLCVFLLDTGGRRAGTHGFDIATASADTLHVANVPILATMDARAIPDPPSQREGMLVEAFPPCGLGVSVATDGTLYQMEEGFDVFPLYEWEQQMEMTFFVPEVANTPQKERATSREVLDDPFIRSPKIAQKRGTKAALALSRITSPTFGLPHFYVRKLFLTVVVPRMVYALPVWYKLASSSEGARESGTRTPSTFTPTSSRLTSVITGRHSTLARVLSPSLLPTPSTTSYAAVAASLSFTFKTIASQLVIARPPAGTLKPTKDQAKRDMEWIGRTIVEHTVFESGITGAIGALEIPEIYGLNLPKATARPVSTSSRCSTPSAAAFSAKSSLAGSPLIKAAAGFRPGGAWSRPLLALFDSTTPSSTVARTYKSLPRPQCSVLGQLRTAHIGRDAYLLYCFGLALSLNCVLGSTPETVQHFLLACPAYRRQRLELTLGFGTTRLSMKHFLAGLPHYAL